MPVRQESYTISLMAMHSGKKKDRDIEKPPPVFHTSRLFLVKLDQPPTTVLNHLCARFPHVPTADWTRRVDQGQVSFACGGPITRQTPYRQGKTVLYAREVPDEPPAGATESILYQDHLIVVADKPGGMPVTPAGDYVRRSLLVRLRQRTGFADLTPAHRLDRDTQGIVLFVIRRHDRGRYQALFDHGRVKREYMALAPAPPASVRTSWRIENRIAPGTPWFRQKIEHGSPNAVTQIELLERKGNLGLFRVRPFTGKKHQIRVHMASIGHPILGDSFYPDLVRESTSRLELLATQLVFEDPFTGARRCFNSSMSLAPGQAPGGRSRC